MPYVLGVDLVPERPVTAAVRAGHAPPEVFGTGEEPIADCLERLGDDVPMILGGRAYAAHDLVAELLARVVQRVSDWQGGEPEHLAISHPAPWGDYRTLLLRQAWWEPVTLVPRPVAAAVAAGRTRGTVGILSPECFAVVRDGELLAWHEPSGFADLDRDSARRLALARDLDEVIDDGEGQPAAGAALVATQGLAPQPVHYPAGWERADRPPRPPVTITSLNLPRPKRTLQLGRH
ncbi:MAG TPA: hypothetical protein VFC19_15500 [Candidatus Limnocylindrales bacterium]|nr:hypothetical protein [Candidatus Limnocylindrales bacterium]